MEHFDLDGHHSNQAGLDGCTARAAFWLDADRNLIRNAFVFSTGNSHAQTGATPNQLRILALAMHSCAARMEAFARQTGAEIEGESEENQKQDAKL